jgi:hypothetical protein
LIAGLVAIGTIGSSADYTTDDISAGIQDFLICFEMFVASIAHSYAFPPLEFHDPTVEAPTFNQLHTVFSPADVVREVTAPVRDIGAGWGLIQNQKLLTRQKSISNVTKLPGDASAVADADKSQDTSDAARPEIELDRMRSSSLNSAPATAEWRPV